MEGIQPTLPVGGMNDGFGNSGIWLFAILALMWGGFGGAGRCGQQNCATQDDLNFSRLENQVRANASLTEAKTDAINNGLCKLGYEMSEKFGEQNILIMTENQKTRDLIQQNKIECLQERIRQLELAQAMCGVVRYPTTVTYTAGTPPIAGGQI